MVPQGIGVPGDRLDSTAHWHGAGAWQRVGAGLAGAGGQADCDKTPRGAGRRLADVELKSTAGEGGCKLCNCCPTVSCCLVLLLLLLLLLQCRRRDSVPPAQSNGCCLGAQPQPTHLQVWLWLPCRCGLLLQLTLEGLTPGNAATCQDHCAAWKGRARKSQKKYSQAVAATAPAALARKCRSAGAVAQGRELTVGSTRRQGRCRLSADAACWACDHHHKPLGGAANEAQAGQPPHP